MVRLEPIRTGFALATFLGVSALLWITLIITGTASSLLNSFLHQNFIVATLQIAPFEFSRAFSLLCVAIGFGFACGLIFAGIWNYYRRH